MDKYDILEKEKFPVSLDKHIGIEIEFVSPFKDYKLEEFLVEVDLQNNCQLKDDSSIDPVLPSMKHLKPKHDCDNDDYDWDVDDCEACNQSYGYSHELTVLTTEKDMKAIMSRVSKFLKRAKAEVNSSCGLHVHLDCRQRKFKTTVNRFLSKQKEMQGLVKKDRLSNTYCKPLAKAETKIKGFSDRYRDINITSFQQLGTLEIRLHHGTVNTKEICGWVTYLINVADKKKVSKVYVETTSKKYA